MTQNTTFFPLSGGLNLISPALATPPGSLRAGVNHEPDPRGYRRIDGYERFDGQPKPSAAEYAYITFTAGAHAPDIGQEVVGTTSAARGIVIAITLDTGTWAGGDAAGTIIVRPTTGTFIDGEDIQTQDVLAFSSGFSSGYQ